MLSAGWLLMSSRLLHHLLTALPAGLLTAMRAVSAMQCMHLFRDTSPVLLATGGASLQPDRAALQVSLRSSAAGVSLHMLCLHQPCCMCLMSRQPAHVLGAAGSATSSAALPAGGRAAC